jgi:peptide deformylase
MKLPDFVVINNPACSNKEVLRQTAEAVSFPLSSEDRDCIAMLQEKFSLEATGVGLAAPQLGFSKRIILLEVNADPGVKQWRKDLTDAMPRTIWINPGFEPVGQERSVDYEACFSVADLAGEVSRFTTIRYTACTEAGERIEGTATGFLARVIQHEIDHLNGKLFIDYVAEGGLVTMAQYREARAKAMEAEPGQ